MQHYIFYFLAIKIWMNFFPKLLVFANCRRDAGNQWTNGQSAGSDDRETTRLSADDHQLQSQLDQTLARQNQIFSTRHTQFYCVQVTYKNPQSAF